jgi:hypothetical protein
MNTAIDCQIYEFHIEMYSVSFKQFQERILVELLIVLPVI